MSPSRRTLLRTCGVGLSAAVGGCLSSSDGSSTTDLGTTAETAPLEVREVDRVTRNVPSAVVGRRSGDPFRSLAVGSRESVPNPDGNKPHGLWVWNETDETMTVELALTADGEWVLNESHEFESGANLAIELREPGHYELAVRAGDREEVVEVERGRFDCNDSATDVAIRDDEIECGWITTEMAC